MRHDGEYTYDKTMRSTKGAIAMKMSERTTYRMNRCRRIHFVGIGGVGMCGIAEVLLNDGYTVSGSDLSESTVTSRLKKLGATVYIGHKATNIEDVDVVVISSAVNEHNQEVQAARAKNIPIIPRAEMLGELMRFKCGIAVAGTHGKTTTTSLIASIMAEGELDPSYVIGGKLNSLGATAKLGASPYFIAEADESDASFLYLKPTIAVVTNVDADHMATYKDDFNQLRQTFIDFIHQLPFYGLAVMCVDDPVVKEILERIQRPVITYGFDEDAQISAYDWRQEGLMSTFCVKRNNAATLNVRLNLPGRHNVLNALAAIAVATEVGIKDDLLLQALSEFQGVGRRFQLYKNVKINNKSVTIIDDYGHHPNEILATTETIKKVWPTKRLVHVFQPHRYSRTQSLYKDFCHALAVANELVLLDIYSAGESPIEGVSSEIMAQDIKTSVHVVSLDTTAKKLDDIVGDDDVILVQGAGSIGQLINKLVTK